MDEIATTRTFRTGSTPDTRTEAQKARWREVHESLRAAKEDNRVYVAKDLLDDASVTVALAFSLLTEKNMDPTFVIATLDESISQLLDVVSFNAANVGYEPPDLSLVRSLLRGSQP